MCGFAGVVGAVGRTKLAETAAGMLRHRGPDASGSRNFEGAALAHRRLRVLDLSAEGDQPLANEDGTVWIAYNGEIYNHAELRDELEGAGHRFRSHTDTEVLVHLYEEHGPDLVHRLRGMFAFALWDDRQRRLLLARDRLGIKPLYYDAATPGRLRFASETRALGAPGQGLTDTAIAAYLQLGWVPGPATILADVREILPGHRLIWSDGRAQVERWWSPPYRQTRSDDLAPVAASLSDAVKRHLIADVPVGLFLSSGVDSAAIACLSSALRSQLTAYTVAVGGVNDESERAASLASALDLKHVTVPVSGAEILASIDRFIADLDQPSVDGLNTWVVSRAVRQAGAVVALSGLGGDELFGGYSTFRHVPRMASAGRQAAWLPAPLRSLPAAALGRSSRLAHSRGRRALEGIAAGGSGAAYAAVRGTLSLGELELLRPGSAALLFQQPPITEADGTVTGLECENYLPFQLLRDTDITSMAHSLEVRVPLLDDDVVSAALRLSPHAGSVTGKARLATAIGHPALAASARAPKLTFTLPIEAWLRGSLARWSRDALAHIGETDLGFDPQALDEFWRAFQNRRSGWRSLWMLVILGAWLDSRGC